MDPLFHAPEYSSVMFFFTTSTIRKYNTKNKRLIQKRKDWKNVKTTFYYAWLLLVL